MKIISINVNGIRSAANKGLFNWLEQENPDIICFQEIKCDLDKIPREILTWNNYYTQFYPAQKSGYSGVAIFSKQKPRNVIFGIENHEFDAEGRSLQFDFKDFSVISLYLPSGSSGPDKQLKKFKFMEYYQQILQQILHSQKNYIICGDWNIAHNEIDLKNWKGNLKNSGFLPEERQWISKLFAEGYVDVWRNLYPQEPGYTWWSNRGQAYNKNVGWRIDYQIVTHEIYTQATSASIYKQIKFSDHAPLIMQYSL
jgi:exodeoxyribonuclease-3